MFLIMMPTPDLDRWSEHESAPHDRTVADFENLEEIAAWVSLRSAPVSWRNMKSGINVLKRLYVKSSLPALCPLWESGTSVCCTFHVIAEIRALGPFG